MGLVICILLLAENLHREMMMIGTVLCLTMPHLYRRPFFLFLLQNNLELHQFENQNDVVCTSISFYDRKATETKKTVSDGNNHQIEDATSPTTVRMRTGVVSNHH